MPIIDKPLCELEVYTGVNPKPDDFDIYWDNAIMEMRAVDPQVVMKKADFETPAILKFHGYSGNCGSWGGGKLAYAASGYAVFAMDARGQGEKVRT